MDAVMANEIDPVKYGVLWERVQNYERRFDEMSAKMELDLANKTANIEVQRERIQSEQEREQARLATSLITDYNDTRSKERLEGAKIGVEIAKEAVKQLGATGE